MFTEEYSRYTLLARSHSTSWWNLDKRTVILLTALTLPVFIFCAAYMTLFGVYDKVVYPRSIVLSDMPQQSLHRAEVYNKFISDRNITDIHLKLGQFKDISEYKLVCYYNFPTSVQSLQINDLDPFLCTHINVAFAQVVNRSIYLNKKDQNFLEDLVQLKKTNSDLKILLSVGGAGGGCGFSDMVYNHTNRKSFIKSVIYYVKNYGIDGVDLDWEFPDEDPAGDKHQRMHFTQLLEELRAAVTRQTKYKFLISVAVAAPANIVDFSYDVPYMNVFVDYINLMSYDYHYYTKYTPFTGINSPLYATSSEKFYLSSLNMNYSANYWNTLGMDRRKIIVGLPTYGHTFRLVNAQNNGLYAPSLGFGKLGSHGFADFSQVCSFLTANHISPVFDMDAKSPYASKSSEWLSFDNTESLTYKAEYIRNNKYGGAMVYSLNSDDYRGICKSPGGDTQRFPLVKVVKQVLEQNDV